MIYSAVWRALPGPTPLKVLEALLLLGAVVVVCFQLVFPHIADSMPFNNQTITGSAGTPGR